MATLFSKIRDRKNGKSSTTSSDSQPVDTNNTSNESFNPTWRADRLKELKATQKDIDALNDTMRAEANAGYAEKPFTPLTRRLPGMDYPQQDTSVPDAKPAPMSIGQLQNVDVNQPIVQRATETPVVTGISNEHPTSPAVAGQQTAAQPAATPMAQQTAQTQAQPAATPMAGQPSDGQFYPGISQLPQQQLETPWTQTPRKETQQTTAKIHWQQKPDENGNKDVTVNGHVYTMNDDGSLTLKKEDSTLTPGLNLTLAYPFNSAKENGQKATDEELKNFAELHPWVLMDPDEAYNKYPTMKGYKRAQDAKTWAIMNGKELDGMDYIDILQGRSPYTSKRIETRKKAFQVAAESINGLGNLLAHFLNFKRAKAGNPIATIDDKAYQYNSEQIQKLRDAYEKMRQKEYDDYITDLRKQDDRNWSEKVKNNDLHRAMTLETYKALIDQTSPKYKAEINKLIAETKGIDADVLYKTYLSEYYKAKASHLNDDEAGKKALNKAKQKVEEQKAEYYKRMAGKVSAETGTEHAKAGYYRSAARKADKEGDAASALTGSEIYKNYSTGSAARTNAEANLYSAHHKESSGTKPKYKFGNNTFFSDAELVQWGYENNLIDKGASTQDGVNKQRAAQVVNKLRKQGHHNKVND